MKRQKSLENLIHFYSTRHAFENNELLCTFSALNYSMTNESIVLEIIQHCFRFMRAHCIIDFKPHHQTILR